jgi:hypothetical protein
MPRRRRPPRSLPARSLSRPPQGAADPAVAQLGVQLAHFIREARADEQVEALWQEQLAGCGCGRRVRLDALCARLAANLELHRSLLGHAGAPLRRELWEPAALVLEAAAAAQLGRLRERVAEARAAGGAAAPAMLRALGGVVRRYLREAARWKGVGPERLLRRELEELLARELAGGEGEGEGEGGG